MEKQFTGLRINFLGVVCSYQRKHTNNPISPTTAFKLRAVKQLIWGDYGRGKKLLIRNESFGSGESCRRVVSVEVTSVDWMFIRIVIDFLYARVQNVSVIGKQNICVKFSRTSCQSRMLSHHQVGGVDGCKQGFFGAYALSALTQAKSTTNFSDALLSVDASVRLKKIQ